jgi:hypothetical protein
MDHFSRVSLKEVELRWYDVSSLRDEQSFLRLRDEVFRLLDEGYGQNSRHPSTYMKRIYEEEHVVLLAMENSGQERRIIGCSYIRSDGKRGGTVVDLRCAGNGLGDLLVKETLSRFPAQYSEVRAANGRQRGLLERNGFTPVNDPEVLRRKLRVLAESSWLAPGDEGPLAYIRPSWDDPSRVNKYIMYQKPRSSYE